MWSPIHERASNTNGRRQRETGKKLGRRRREWYWVEDEEKLGKKELYCSKKEISFCSAESKEHVNFQKNIKSSHKYKDFGTRFLI